MEQTERYYVVKQRAVPEVLLKVVEAKKLLDSGKVATVNEAAEQLGISRSSFYKYKDDIYQFHDSSLGMIITLTMEMDDEPGLLSDLLKVVAAYQANILTIHQSIPTNGIASLSLSIQILQATRNFSEMMGELADLKGVHHIKVVSRENQTTI